MSKKRLSDWALIAELVGAGAVILSLFYLAYEVNQNSKITEATMRATLASQDIDFLSLRIDPAVLAIAKTKKRLGEPLSPFEYDQLEFEQGVNFRIFEHSFYQYEKGTLELSEWKRHEEIALRHLSTNEHAQSMWEKGVGFAVTFRNHLDSKLKE